MALSQFSLAAHESLPMSHDGAFMRGESDPLVMVEFLFVDRAAAYNEVRLCVSRNDWEPQEMTKDASGRWSLITPLPVGYIEYVFCVDGVFVTSNCHPKSRDGSVNWRNVHGPQRLEARPAFITREFTRRVRSPQPRSDEESLDGSYGSDDDMVIEKEKTPPRNEDSWRPILMFTLVFLLYLCIYTSTQSGTSV